MTTATKKTAFVLLAFGGADSVDNCEPFLKNIFKGRPLSAEVIEKIRERYRLIGGRSPLLDITRAQADAIRSTLKAQWGIDYKGYVGMRFWHPFIKDTLKEMAADGVERAIAVIMSPFTTLATSGGYDDDVAVAVKELGAGMKVEFIKNWHLRPLFIKAIIENVEKELERFENRKDALVIFSSHSIARVALEGDPYEMQVHQTVDRIVGKMGVDYKVAYQSKGAGPRDWMGPSVEEAIEGAHKTGKKGVIVVPLGFAADHVETLYDIDILFKACAESKGLYFARTASMNINEKLMLSLSEMIAKHTDGREYAYGG
ncbi:MAG: ferrochelatase [Deltaproteobacteria bacterium]|nr:ferrochelatase [Deltaproteobacteria bacterium]